MDSGKKRRALIHPPQLPLSAGSQEETSARLTQENLHIASEGVIYPPYPRGRGCVFCFKKGIQTEQEEGQQQRIGGTKWKVDHEN